MVQEPPPINGLRNTVMNVLENLERYHDVIERSETLDKKLSCSKLDRQDRGCVQL